MKKNICIGMCVLGAFVISGLAQSNQSEPAPGPGRVVVTNTMPTAQPVRTPVPVVPRPAQTPMGAPVPNSQASNLTYKGLSFSQIKARIAEAKRAMQTRPVTTAMSEPLSFTSLVRIAYYDSRDKKVDYVVLTKEAFLTPNSPTVVLSSNGRRMTARTIRANGVNTPVVIADESGQPHLPLVVQYPVEKGGRYV